MSIIQGLIGSISGVAPPYYYLGLGGSYGEGNTLTLTISYEHARGDTVYWSLASDSATAGVDFTSDNGYSGSLSPSGTGTQTLANITNVADNTTEGIEYYQIRLGTYPGGNDIYSNNININDTSTDPLADFTIEWWGKMNSSQPGQYPRLFDVNNYSSEQPGISFESGNTVMVWNGTSRDTAYVDFSYNQWTHWAIVRHNNTMSLYKNGTNILSSNYLGTLAFTNTTSPLTIGYGSSQYWNGKIADFNWVKGIARYTANFTPARQPTYITAGYTKLLLNAASEANKLVDAATGKTVTEHNTVAYDIDTPWLNRPVSKALTGAGNTLGVFSSPFPTGWYEIRPGWTITRSGFSSTVVSFNGNDQIVAADNWINDSGEYTFTPPSSVVHTSVASTHGTYYGIQFTDQGLVDLQSVRAGWTAFGPGGVGDIVAEDVVWSGSDYKVKLINATDWPAVGEWTFTPPQQTGSLVFSNSYLSLAATNDWALDIFGSSLYFNGSQGRYVQVADATTDWALGDNYTIEWWEKVADSAGFYSVMCQAAATDAIDIYHQSGYIGMCNGEFNFAEPPVNQWNHIVIQKDGTTASAYVNGVAQTLNTNNLSTLSNDTLNLVIGFRTSDGGSNFYPNQKFNGYITNIRISDIARYSGEFTPPLTVDVDSHTKLALSGVLGGAGPLDDVSPSNHTINNNLTTVEYKFPQLQLV